MILLSGGSGKRLWPLSNDVYSKQFIRLFRREDGVYESMMMRAYRGIREAGDAQITVATGAGQVSAIRSQLGDGINICTEPCRRDTFPAIALAAAQIKRRGAGDGDMVISCPVDAYVEEDYYRALHALGRLAQDSPAQLTLMGVQPTEPSEKYGYILPKSRDEISAVASFHEKPSPEDAAAYIRRGALWNSGVFAFRLGYVLEKARALLGSDDYDALLAAYANLPQISFDYAVSEKEKSICVVRFSGTWKDIGTWNSLADVLHAQSIGPTQLDTNCQNVSVINQLDIPVLGMGLKDTVICVAPDGILVSDKESSVRLKTQAEILSSESRYAERSWGTYQVLAADRNGVTRRIIMPAEKRMRYHSHAMRDECWVITSGVGEVLFDGKRRLVGPGDMIRLPRGVKHRLAAKEDLTLIEVQTGDYFGADDRQFFSEEDAAE